MQKHINLTLIAMLLAFMVNATNRSQDFVIITDGVVYATANDYMSAISVTVELISTDNRVQASATTTAGQTVQFTLADNSQKVRTTYHFENGGGTIVIIDEIMI